MSRNSNDFESLAILQRNHFIHDSIFLSLCSKRASTNRESSSTTLITSCTVNHVFQLTESVFIVPRSYVDLAVFHRELAILYISARIIASNRIHRRKISSRWSLNRIVKCAVQLDNEGMRRVDVASSSKCNQGPCTSINNAFFVVTDVRAPSRLC